MRRTPIHVGLVDDSDSSSTDSEHTDSEHTASGTLLESRREENSNLGEHHGGTTDDTNVLVTAASALHFEEQSEYDMQHSGQCDVRKSLEDLEPEGADVQQESLLLFVDAMRAAAASNGVQLLQVLQQRGLQLDRANQQGRTLLMEAAIWGNLGVVQHLIQQRVDRTLTDKDGLRAADLAADTERNERERKERLSGIFSGQLQGASRRREEIRDLLDASTSHEPKILDRASASEGFILFDRRTDGTLACYQLQSLLDPPSTYPNKAFGTLYRGPQYPLLYAMSGYSHRHWPNVLDNQLWTSKAQSLMAILDLPPDKDAASHVEPQLLTYLLDSHWPGVLEAKADARMLAETMPLIDFRAIITVSKDDLCSSCSDLFSRFESMFPRFDIAVHCVGDRAGATILVQR